MADTPGCSAVLHSKVQSCTWRIDLPSDSLSVASYCALVQQPIILGGFSCHRLSVQVLGFWMLHPDGTYGTYMYIRTDGPMDLGNAYVVCLCGCVCGSWVVCGSASGVVTPRIFTLLVITFTHLKLQLCSMCCRKDTDFFIHEDFCSGTEPHLQRQILRTEGAMVAQNESTTVRHTKTNVR